MNPPLNLGINLEEERPKLCSKVSEMLTKSNDVLAIESTASDLLSNTDSLSLESADLRLMSTIAKTMTLPKGKWVSTLRKCQKMRSILMMFLCTSS